MAAFYGLLVLVCLDGSVQPGRSLTWRPLVWFGQRSYAIYLLHQALFGLSLGVVAESGLSQIHPRFATCLVIGAALAATLAGADISYRFLESPIIRWGHRFRYRVAVSGCNETTPDEPGVGLGN
jgi:peptidoglycan/LPS O-acetylase OafA/YrhL